MHSPFPTVPSARTRSAGFSLPEVAMAIGIIAIAFVALIGLLPTGLNQMRAAMDSNNETRIIQTLTSRALATEYNKLNELEGIIYYFDDEGSQVDSSQDEIPSKAASRLYAAKVFLDTGVVEQNNTLPLAYSKRMLIAYGSIFDTRASELEQITSVESLQQMLEQKKPKPNPIVRAVTIAKTDGKLLAAP